MYNDRRWRKRRSQHLALSPYCVYCERRGIVTIATVADHITPHRGDPVLFDGPIQSLCARCHDSVKSCEETGRALRDIGIDGYPVDSSHQFNKVK
jgi:5-methylcytosine-specific restriction protein A